MARPSQELTRTSSSPLASREGPFSGDLLWKHIPAWTFMLHGQRWPSENQSGLPHVHSWAQSSVTPNDTLNKMSHLLIRNDRRKAICSSRCDQMPRNTTILTYRKAALRKRAEIAMQTLIQLIVSIPSLPPPLFSFVLISTQSLWKECSHHASCHWEESRKERRGSTEALPCASSHVQSHVLSCRQYGALQKTQEELMLLGLVNQSTTKHQHPSWVSGKNIHQAMKTINRKWPLHQVN